ncbi:hypothetical protein A8C56_03085 [Niabella ginsenosidivorans]|uniref:Uncharacterized protein n=1 Tax=Niabella ginsenosidivorans TaxID=1176587 RepID=A0A1A9I0M2_9BACT|nr:hypothetical protein [Niabella ginsenosidivorans]ANH80104.1 hypothetical protein A8C56_03085 [Niabella ginsenosidivorans]
MQRVTVTLLVFLLGALLNVACAQKKGKIIKVPSKPEIVEFPVAEIKVFQAVPDSSYLGYAQKGLANSVVRAYPDGPLTPFIQRYFDNSIHYSSDSGAKKFFIVIKELRINERTFAMKERAYARLQADAWVGAAADKYYLAASVDTCIMHGGMDVTASHGRNIGDLLFLLIHKAAASPDTAGEHTQLLTIEEVRRKANERFTVPVLLTDHYQNGIYLTYNEFLQNAPSVRHYSTQFNKKKGARFFIKDSTGNEQEIIPWGLCKDDELYKYKEHNLIPIERVANGFFISSYLENKRRRNNAVFWGALVGGIAGGVAAGAISGGQVTYIAVPYYGANVQAFMQTNIPALKKSQAEASSVDFSTGELYF